MKQFLLPVLLVSVLSAPAQNAGIGVPNPTHARLEINGRVGAAVAMFGSDRFGLAIESDNPEIGFNYYFNGSTRTIKAGYAANAGMDPADGSFYIGTFNGNVSASDFGAISGYRETLRMKQNGNVGIGTDPLFPLTIRSVSGGGMVQESPDGTAQVGFWTGTNAAYLQTWTNTPLNFATGNGVSRMVLNTNGTFVINKSLNVGDKVLSPAAGSSNLAPFAMASIAQDGSIIRSTGNISCTRNATGQYSLLLSGENLNIDANKFTTIVTASSSDDNTFLINNATAIILGGAITVSTNSMFINTQLTACGCASSYILSSSPRNPRDCGFDIIVYKNN